MKYQGLSTEASRQRIKYRCPIKADPKIAVQFNNKCPINDPHFGRYGCTRYVDVTNDARAQVPRESEFFKNTYRKRIAAEQYFARFGDRIVEQTTHYKLRSVKNQISIGHLSLVLVAAAAVALVAELRKSAVGGLLPLEFDHLNLPKSFILNPQR